MTRVVVAATVVVAGVTIPKGSVIEVNAAQAAAITAAGGTTRTTTTATVMRDSLGESFANSNST